MIESFKSGETKLIFDQVGSLKLPEDIQVAAKRKLDMIDSAPAQHSKTAINIWQ